MNKSYYIIINQELYTIDFPAASREYYKYVAEKTLQGCLIGFRIKEAPTYIVTVSDNPAFIDALSFTVSVKKKVDFECVASAT
jgi:hypothetical protein